jgi:hypothetical protein
LSSKSLLALVSHRGRATEQRNLTLVGNFLDLEALLGSSLSVAM